ncbi:hypothetical protein TVAG_171230 [Trichomonas vaginalis G3]|uniref:Importin N-terminal domain-containing protein n=2 Tax=Trichomonas vaginalis (strain ATCC PRA-98 / G3) TaxID=412133 RepID=A2FYX3_TRIV3|nr:hypothetical protein TVAG_171230 [Trichomonas vaginalis G3]|eukprot:XP_001302824.1 hypothetical protein [Trichomonas vaginalis G3]
MPEEVQEIVKQALIEIVQKCDSYKTLTNLAEAVATIFKASILWTPAIHMVVYFHQKKNPECALLFLSKIIPLVEGGTVHELWTGFRAIAMTSLASEKNSVKFMAFEVFFVIYSIEESFDILIPVIETVTGMLEQYKSLSEQDFDKLWSYIRKILKIKQLNEDIILHFLQAAATQVEDSSIKSIHRSNIISSIIPVIPQLDENIMSQFINASVLLAVTYIQEVGEQPKEMMIFIDQTLQIRVEISAPIVYQNFQEMFGSEDLEQTIVAVNILSSLIEYAGSTLEDDLETVKTAILQALNSEDLMLIEASLRCLEVFNESTANVASLAREFIPIVVNYLVSEDSDIRVIAYNSMMSLCPLCESSIPDLLNTLWKMQEEGTVHEEDIENYILLLALVIEMEDLNDQMVDTILQFAIQNLADDKEPTLKAVTLTIIGTLIEYDDQIPQKISNLAEIINELFHYDNQDVVTHVLAFLRNISVALRGESLVYVQPFIEEISKLISSPGDPRVFSSALETASAIIRRTKDMTLLDAVCSALNMLFRSDEVELMKDACTQIPQISFAISEPNETNKQRSEFFLVQLIRIVNEEIDVDLLEVAVEALTYLLKFCTNHDPENFINSSVSLLQSIIDGDTAFGAGESPIETVVQPELAQYFIEFFFAVLQLQEQVNLDILQFCLTWMQQNTVAIDPVIGELSELIVKREIDEKFVSEILEFCKSLSDTTNARIQQHVITLLSRVTRVYPNSLALCMEFVPIADKWYKNEKGKDGFGDVISNIASFYLCLDVNDEYLIESLSLFPPSDIKESKFMSESLLNRLNQNQNQEVATQMALAIARLITEPLAISAKRKVSGDVLNGLQQFLASFMRSSQESAQFILQHFEDSQKKLEILHNLIE